MTEVDVSPDGASPAEGAAPDPNMRISLERHAQVTAELAEGNRKQPEVLEAHGFTEAEWQQATLYWMDQLGSDVEKNGAEATLAVRYSDAFARQQDALAPRPTLSPEQWAELQYDIEQEGSPEGPLAHRQLSLADYFRLVRVFSKKLAQDPETQVRFSERDKALRNPP